MFCSFYTWLELFNTMCGSIRQFAISDFFTEFPSHPFLCSTNGSCIPNPKSHKIFHFIWWDFFLQGLKTLKLFTDVKSHEFFFSTILKNGRDSFSLGILKNAQVASPTNALGGWYIYWQPAIVVFRAGLYQQPLLKFSRVTNYW